MTAPTTRPARVDDGITLIELLAVITIIAILAGMSVTVFSGLANRYAFDGVVARSRSLIRHARNRARQEQFPSTVRIQAGKPGQPSKLRAVTRKTLGLWHFETDSIVGGADDDTGDVAPELRGAWQLRARLDGATIEPARLGDGVYFESGGAHVEIAHSPRLAPREGLQIELWVQPFDFATMPEDLRKAKEKAAEEAGEEDLPLAFDLISKLGSFYLSVTETYGMEVGIEGPPPDSTKSGMYQLATPDRILVPGRWHRIELIFDGLEIRLLVDGVDRVLNPLESASQLIFDGVPTRLERSSEPIYVSSPDVLRSFYGAVDELLVAGIVTTESYEVPASVELRTSRTLIRFTPGGALDPMLHDRPVTLILGELTEIPAPKRAGEKKEKTGEKGETEARKDGESPGEKEEPSDERYKKKAEITIGRSGLIR